MTMMIDEGYQTGVSRSREEGARVEQGRSGARAGMRQDQGRSVCRAGADQEQGRNRPEAVQEYVRNRAGAG